ncbi:MAG: DNA polymerase III subunit gamma/tau [Aminobacterium sp.]|uniref:DNA polymerase III subunit gamma/tau n=1 Tax=Aminobacterium sp. TaxID=1872491 RepID=UPI002B1F6169|nr:DNA polymerase III subunit gamma/tau [Aminobacterium sp.]MEA4878143.1 DNA polymerase III subunit gamma/tau [Aminobacterium sp.]
MTVSLYRRYRPAQFSQVIAQEAAVQVITKALEDNRVSHAYLFSGPRGCGKTTLARLLAKALNCVGDKDGVEPCNKCVNCTAINRGESLDVIEIDGASNNSVDEVRELKSHVSLSPFASLYKVYIIDEVHMLSISAFNALLKTLEEPPSHVIFILATTEPHKVPVTIRSRCQHIPFRKIDALSIVTCLKDIIQKENREAEEDALWEIARQADGAMRDAQSLLEQVMALAGKRLEIEDVNRLLGGGSRPELERWVASVRSADMSIFTELQNMFRRGASPQKVVEDLFVIFRDLWITKSWGKDSVSLLEGSSSEKNFLLQESPFWKSHHLLSLMDFCAKILPHVRMGMKTDVLSGLFLNKLIEDEILTQHSDNVEKKTSKKKLEVVAEPKVIEVFQEPQEPQEPSKPKESYVQSVTLKEKWEELLTSFIHGDIHMYSALLYASVSFENGLLTLEFPEYCKYSLELLSVERNAFILQQKIEEVFNEKLTLQYICNDKTLEYDFSSSKKISESEEAVFEIQDEPTKVLPFDDIPSAKPGKSASKTENEQEEDQEQEQEQEQAVFSGLVDAVLRWGGGEVLLHKKENVEEIDGGITEE